MHIINVYWLFIGTHKAHITLH